MTETILIISNDSDFIEQVKAVGDYDIQIENSVPLVLADNLVCVVDVSAGTIAADWIADYAKKSQFVIAFDSEQQIAPYLELAVADYWMKPIHTIELRSRLYTTVNSHQLEQAYREQVKKMYSLLHEIKNSVVPAIGYADILLKSELGVT